MLLQLLSQPIHQRAASAGVAMGQFSPTQSYYDRLQGLQFNQQLMQSMTAGNVGDRQFYSQFLNGLNHIVGGAPLTGARGTAAQQAINDVAAISPALAVTMPRLFDQLHGQRGSSQVLAAELFMSGRGMFNPATGHLGFDGARAGALANSVYADLFAVRGTPGSDADAANLRRTHGFSAGQAGEIFNQLQQMGQGGQLTGNVRQDSRNISRRIEEMTGAVRAMQDIFGDMGHPNAPMHQLMASLDALTAGGVMTMSPERMQQNVRRMQALAHQGGVGFEYMAAAAQAGGMMAEGVGISRQFGVATAQSSMAFRTAFRSLAGNQGFGGFESPDDARVEDQRLRTAAANSSVGRVVGAVQAMAEAGLIHGADPSTPEGRRRLSEISNQVADLGPGQTSQFLQGLGVAPATFNNFLSNHQANNGALFRNGGADIVQARQINEVAQGAIPLAGSAFAGSQPAANLQGIGAAVFGALRQIGDSNPDLLENREGRRPALIQAVQQRLRANNIHGSDAEVANSIQSVEGFAWGQHNRPLASVLSVHGDRIRQEANRNLLNADAQGAAAEGLAGLGQQNVTRRLADVIAAAPGISIGAAVQRLLGAIPQEQRQAAARDLLNDQRVANDPMISGFLRGVAGPQEAVSPAAAGAGGAMRITGTLDLRNGNINANGDIGAVPPPGGRQ
jgi:hypothetical protein